MAFFTYIIRLNNNDLYTGYTSSIFRRLKEHGLNKGAKRTMSKGPIKLEYYESFTTKSEAMKREYAIKKLSKKNKEKLITDFDIKNKHL